LSLLVSGLLNKQVGFELKITEYTVQIHRAHIMRTMEADSFATLVKLATQFTIEPRGHVEIADRKPLGKLIAATETRRQSADIRKSQISDPTNGGGR
jgi:hypothetical protein